MNVRKETILVILSIMGFMLALIPMRILYMEYTIGDSYRELAKKYTIEHKEVPPDRGSIYDEKGNLLLTSVPIYTAAVDPKQGKSSDRWSRELDTLSQELHTRFPVKFPNPLSFKRKYESAKRRGREYLEIKNQLDYAQMKALKKLPILKYSPFRGGLISHKKGKRVKPFADLASRTLGSFYEHQTNHVGLEGGYHAYLGGEKGYMQQQKILGNEWKTINSPLNVEPTDGADLVTHLDVRIQDMCHNALLKQLEFYEAENGCMVLMDVTSGAIKAMVNLSKQKDGSYRESVNSAVGHAREPGSTFKLLSYLVALEDGVIDTNTVIETGKGSYRFYGQTMRDSKRGGFGTLTVKQAFEKSSNIAVGRLIDEHYGKKPQDFINKLARLGVNEPLGVPIPGEAKPIMKNVGDKLWNLNTLPWMSYGYEITLTPLQLLTYYNAIANNGELVKPQFVKEVRRAGRTIKTFDKEVLMSSICSKSTLRKLKAMMEGVVSKHGTASNIASDVFTSAGKTGTCQLEYWKDVSPKKYQSSFVGYFPKDNPRYSCIVVVQKPDTRKGYYGNIVAAPAFEQVRNGLFSEQPVDISESLETVDTKLKTTGKMRTENWIRLSKSLDMVMPKEQVTQKWSLVGVEGKSYTIAPIDMQSSEIVPNLKGMTSTDALYILELLGVDVELEGVGKVVSQTPAAGSRIRSSEIHTLWLN